MPVKRVCLILGLFSTFFKLEEVKETGTTESGDARCLYS
jgi:hypothetical protein